MAGKGDWCKVALYGGGRLRLWGCVKLYLRGALAAPIARGYGGFGLDRAVVLGVPGHCPIFTGLKPTSKSLAVTLSFLRRSGIYQHV